MASETGTPGPTAAMASWTQRLWADVAHTYDAILDHPFLHGLTDATLPQGCFAAYLAQDAHYLRDYARALAVVGAEPPTHALTGMFAAHAAQTVEVELALHEQLLPALGVDPAATVSTVLEVADRAGESLSEQAEAAARAHFLTTARYEWMFWHGAWRREGWPV